jgi:tRNA-2-methylthio-N6-dimethylallyladenosine synthase
LSDTTDNYLCWFFILITAELVLWKALVLRGCFCYIAIFDMNTKKLHVKCFGCQMNKLDSSLVTSALCEGGYRLTDKASDADVVVINTCSVREHAEERVLSNLGHLKHIKKTRPEIIVAVIGCMAQRLGNELLSHEVVDIVAGPGQIPQITSLINNAVETKQKLLAVTEKIRHKPADSENTALDEFELVYDSDKNYIAGQAFVRVMRGCNNFCAYCVVPYVRGPEVSRPPSAIIEQVKKLAEQGVKQITLLGQTINSYSYTDGTKSYTLADLLEMTSRVDGIEWIRFITSHPGKFDDSILRAMAELPKVCPYLHIPAQSGSDTILKSMNRRYTAQQYLELLDKARQIVPEISIAGDFIVGFPGETEADFESTVELVKKAQFKNCFVFKYSPRPGTSAKEKLKDNIPYETKSRRNIELLEVQNQISTKQNKRYLNQTVKVLVEGPSKKAHLNAADNESTPQLTGRTGGDYIVVFNGPMTLAGEFVKVKINKTSALTLIGELG